MWEVLSELLTCVFLFFPAVFQTSPFEPPKFVEEQLASFGDLAHHLLNDHFCSQVQFHVQPEPPIAVRLAFSQPLMRSGIGPRPFSTTAMEATCVWWGMWCGVGCICMGVGWVVSGEGRGYFCVVCLVGAARRWR